VRTTKPSAPKSWGKLWLSLEMDVEELQGGALLAIQVALTGASRHMAMALILAIDYDLWQIS
jgi:hypothetical protein